MNKIYQRPEMAIMEMLVEDVIRTSDDNYFQWSWSEEEAQEVNFG